MATGKDLTEAYAFGRRRLVTAFVSGAPGGREVEPERPGRTLVGGLALSVLLVAGAAVAGAFSPRVDENWVDENWAEQPGLVISRESGAAYVITDTEGGAEPVLRPVVNITSAKLILGAGTTPTIIPEEHIDRVRRGDDVGILGAPASVPDPDRLIDDGWTACTGPTPRVRLHVSADPPVSPAPAGGALLVSVRGARDGSVYVIADSGAESEGGLPTRTYSYRLPPSPGRDNLIGALGLSEASAAVPVPEEWLTLFPSGGALTRDAFGLADVGAPAGYVDDLTRLRRARVGDVLDLGTQLLLLGRDGPVRLTPFAATVYLESGDEQVLEPSTAPPLTRERPSYLAARWPDSPLTPVPGEQCVQLSASAESRPGTRLVTAPAEDASAAGTGRRTRNVVVDEGAGAYVLAGGWEVGGDRAPHLVASDGVRYPLVGPDAASRLGYGDYPAPQVPDSWVALFRKGVPLSVAAALCPPITPVGKPCG